MPWCTSSTVAPQGSLKGRLTIVDELTGKRYQVPVSEDGTFKSVDLKKITTGKDDKGLKLYDPGYLNTAPVRSSISYINGYEGIMRYHGYPIEDLAESSTSIEVSYLLISWFIKILGPYYMLVITKRREIGEICGYRVYEVSKSTRGSCVRWTLRKINHVGL
ncbi:hypothetical protein HA466_0285550 [Hirschfeldia incana]|nr:hypothetical protein HA466_0285550 [Hirschfeldia incana]